MTSGMMNRRARALRQRPVKAPEEQQKHWKRPGDGGNGQRLLPVFARVLHKIADHEAVLPPRPVAGNVARPRRRRPGDGDQRPEDEQIGERQRIHARAHVRAGGRVGKHLHERQQVDARPEDGRQPEQQIEEILPHHGAPTDAQRVEKELYARVRQVLRAKIAARRARIAPGAKKSGKKAHALPPVFPIIAERAPAGKGRAGRNLYGKGARLCPQSAARPSPLKSC